MKAANVGSREGDVESLPLPDDFADVVISHGMLSLSLDKVETLRERLRLLKPGGRLQGAIFWSSGRRPRRARRHRSMDGLNGRRSAGCRVGRMPKTV